MRVLFLSIVMMMSSCAAGNYYLYEGKNEPKPVVEEQIQPEEEPNPFRHIVFWVVWLVILASCIYMFKDTFRKTQSKEE